MSPTSASDILWYQENQSNYEELAERVEKILDEILNIEKINYALIQSRGKSTDSFQKKLKEINYSGKDLSDLAGIRVAGYVKSDVEKIIKIIRNNFEVDEGKSKNKYELLSPDRFGYRAVHLVCKLPKERTVLPEYKKFKDMFFEIQIKTILEHAWAEIEHDRNYKYKALPSDIQRDFYLLAGALESADKQFDQINKRIEDYDKTIKQKTKEGKLKELEINPSTLKQYLINKFSSELQFEHSYGWDESGNSEVEELTALGISNMSQFEEIIQKKFVELKKTVDSSLDRTDNNLSSLLFSILLFKYGNAYFDIAKKFRGYPKEKFSKAMKMYENALTEIKSS